MRWGLAIAIAAVLVVGVAAYAVGAGKSSSDVTLCAVKKSGELSLAASGKCAKGEKKLTLAKEGPIGPQGPAGPAGAAAVNTAPEAIHFVTGPANDECFAKPGTFCEVEGGYEEWGNYAPTVGAAGYYKDASGVVHLSGIVSITVHGGEVGSFIPEGPFYLPPEYRPSVARVFSVTAQKFSSEEFTIPATAVVRPNGAVAIKIKSGQEFLQVSLDGIEFRLP